MEGEPTVWSAGLIAFYVSCTAVGVGAGLAAVVLVVFPDEPFSLPAAVLGLLMVAGGSLGAWLGLRSARREG